MFWSQRAQDGPVAVTQQPSRPIDILRTHIADADGQTPDAGAHRPLDIALHAPSGAPSHDLFICYAGPDKAIAMALHHALADAGLTPWCDAIDLLPGQDWDEVIPAALKASRAVLVLVSKRWPIVGERGEGHYGPDELAIAIEHARRPDTALSLVPVRLDGAETARVPYGLRRKSHIESSSDDFDPIVDGMRRLLGQPSAPTPPPRRRGPDGDVAAAERKRDTLRARGAPPAVIAAADARILALKRSKRIRHKPAEGLELSGRWTLVEQLGKGGFAEVWQAWDAEASALVAVKILHGQFEDSEERRERFFRGARQMARLDHAHVVRVIEPEAEHDGFRFFVMELLPGGDLQRAVLDARMPAPAALRAVLDIADALSTAHAAGVIHRDVKPANILLDADGRAKLTDFDLVRAGDTTGGTRTGALGTFIYAAPEAMENASGATPSCDVFGLGMTAIFALHGKPLPKLVMRRPEALVAKLPVLPALRQELLRAIDWEPAARHASAGAFADALRRAAGLEPR